VLGGVLPVEEYVRWLRALAASVDGGDRVIGGQTLCAEPDDLYSIATQAIVDWAYAFYNDGPGGPRFFASSNLAVPRERFLELGGFDPKFTVSEDRELCDRWRHQGLPLVYAPDARVRHATKSSLSEFARRHFGYGRGAYWFNIVRHRRRSGSIVGDVRFYPELPRRASALVRGAGPRRGLALAGLIVLWQAANVTGFVLEGMQAALARPRSRELHGGGDRRMP